MRARIDSQIVKWKAPKAILIVAKLSDPSLLHNVREVVDILYDCNKDLEIYVEDQIYDGIGKAKLKAWNGIALRDQTSPPDIKHIASAVIDMDDDNVQDKAKLVRHDAPLSTVKKAHEYIDLVISLGGDGTCLFTSWLFQDQVPPILPFCLGSLGFLTLFNYDDVLDILQWVMLSDKQLKHAHSREVHLSMRTRLTCEVYRSQTVRSIMLYDGQQSKAVSHHCPTPDEVFKILNDIVVDRGPSPYISTLELFTVSMASNSDEVPHYLTTVKADGVVIATPTGSTAYSLSAGGSIVHPSVSALLLTPICAHTLSFRPVVLPASEGVLIVVPDYKNQSTGECNNAWASFDGRHRVRLSCGDVVKVYASNDDHKHSLPIICKDGDGSTDWYGSLARCLRWNERGDVTKNFSFGVGLTEEVDETDNPYSYGGRLGRISNASKLKE